MNTIDKNTYRAYINPTNIQDAEETVNVPMHERPINAMNLNWRENIPSSLETRSIQVLAENWTKYPSVFEKFQQCEDKHQFLDILNIEFPLAELCAHIDEDMFWKRMVRHRWYTYFPTAAKNKKWIQIFLEKHLSETLELMKPADYDAEQMQQLAELCGKNVETLFVHQLQPPGVVDHIPFDVILINLPELRKIDLTFDIKNVETNFALGCTNLSDNDIKNLAKGLEGSYELKEFRIHSTKLDPPMLKMIANSLDKACRNLETVAFPHCRFGDAGLKAFLEATTKDSFPMLKEVVLTNNFITSEGILQLSDALKKRNIERLDVRLNPIGSDGASIILSLIRQQPIKYLSLACCSIDENIEKMLLATLKSHRTLSTLDISSNKFNDEMGKLIVEALTDNRTMRELDVRNTKIAYDIKADIDTVVLENRQKETYQVDLY